jgi:hypothetical protein
MPEGLPSAADLWEGRVGFFSIDTDLIQAAGYKFKDGTLNQLPKLIPRPMQLYLTEVVAQEIIAHLMEPVTKAIHDFSSASDALKRGASVPMAGIDNTFGELAVADFSRREFRKRIEDYVVHCRGGVLSIEGDELAGKLFDRYFATLAPFATKRDKKSEFPDALSLLLLEEYAEDQETLGIVASGDQGWADYAASSDRLYCVKSLEELTGLFEATSAHAIAVKDRLLATIADGNSALRLQLSDALVDHIHNASWNPDDAYSGVVARVEAETVGVEMSNYDLHPQSSSVWGVKDDPTAWVIEVTARVFVDVSVYVSFFAWDSIDREEVELGGDEVTREVAVDVQAFLTCSNVEGDAVPDDWDVEIEIGAKDYEVEVGEVEPDFSD